MKDGEIQKDKWQKTGQSCKATIYVQETKGITKVQIGSVYKRADGTFYLEPSGRSSVQDLCKTGGSGISQSFSVDTEEGKMTYRVIINEQLIGMKGQTINRQKIHSAKKNFTYKWKQLGDDGVLTPTDLKFKK